MSESSSQFTYKRNTDGSLPINVTLMAVYL